MANAGRSEDRPVAPRSARHPLPVEILEQGDDELPGEAGHLLEGAHVEAGSRGPALPDVGLEAVQGLAAPQQALTPAFEEALRDEHPPNAPQELRVLARPGRPGPP